jgi:hypothetical protein
LFHRRQGKWIFLQQLVHQRQIIDTLEGKKNPKKERERTHGQPLVHAQLQIEHVGPGGGKKEK